MQDRPLKEYKEWRDRDAIDAIDGAGPRGDVMRFGTPQFVLEEGGRKYASEWRAEAYAEHLLPAYLGVGKWQGAPSWRPADVALIYSKLQPSRHAVLPREFVRASDPPLPRDFAWERLYNVDGLTHVAVVVSYPHRVGDWITVDICSLIPLPGPVSVDQLAATATSCFAWSNVRAQGMQGVSRNSMPLDDLKRVIEAIIGLHAGHSLERELRTALKQLVSFSEEWYGCHDVGRLQIAARELLPGDLHPTTWELT